jgi:hypothetical protein
MLSRHQYTTVCDNLDTILQVVPNNPAINIAVRHLQVMLTEQLLADVKKVSNDKNPDFVVSNAGNGVPRVRPFH